MRYRGKKNKTKTKQHQQKTIILLIIKIMNNYDYKNDKTR